MKMTLSRALRYKKRVIERIRTIESDVQMSNCVVSGEEPNVDVRLALNQRQEWVKHLIALKLALQKGTEPIQRLVFELAETKSEVAFLQRINIQHGTVKARYREEASITYQATIRKPERDKLITELQERIDIIQTKIDQHNATLEIEIPDVNI